MPLEIKKILFPVDSCLPIDKPVIHNAYIEEKNNYGILPPYPILEMFNFNDTLHVMTASMQHDYKIYKYLPNDSLFELQGNVDIPIVRPIVIPDIANQKVYFFGGVLKSDENVYSQVLYVYDQTTKTTTTVNTLSFNLSYGAGCIINEKLLFYGYSPILSKYVFAEYDITTGATITDKPTTPISIISRNMLVFEGNVYGVSDNPYGLWKWDMTASTWTKIASLSFSSPPRSLMLINMTPLTGTGYTTVHLFETINSPTEHEYDVALDIKNLATDGTVGSNFGGQRTSPAFTMSPTDVATLLSPLGFNTVCEVGGFKYFASNLTNNPGHLYPVDYIFGILNYTNNQLVITRHAVREGHVGMILDPLKLSFVADDGGGEYPPSVTVRFYYSDTEFIEDTITLPAAATNTGTWLLANILPTSMKGITKSMIPKFECCFNVRDGSVTMPSLWSDIFDQWENKNQSMDE